MNVNLSRNRPRQGLRTPEGIKAPRIPRKPVREDDKVVSPTHRPPLSIGDNPDTLFC